MLGIDVSSEFSIVAMLAQTGELIRKPFRIDHNPAGLHKLLDILKKEEKRLNRKPIYFVESTGIFHTTQKPLEIKDLKIIKLG